MATEPINFTNLGPDAFKEICRLLDIESITALSETCKSLHLSLQEPLQVEYLETMRRIVEMIAMSTIYAVKTTNFQVLLAAKIAKETMGVADCRSASDRERIWISQLVSRSLTGDDDLPHLSYTLMANSVQASYKLDWDCYWGAEIQVDFEDGIHTTVYYQKAPFLYHWQEPVTTSMCSCKSVPQVDIFNEALEVHPWLLGVVSALYSHHPKFFKAEIIPRCLNEDSYEPLDPALCKKYDVFKALPSEII